MPFTKNKTIDRSNPNYSGLRIILIFILSSGMMYLDFQGNYTDRLRSYLSVAVLPIQIAANAPKKIINNLKNKLSDRESILTENQLLKKENIQLYSKVQQTYKLEAENKRLFELLKAKPEDGENFIFADIIAVNQDNNKHQIIINKGSMDGIELGAAIADSKGIIGHIVRDQVLASEVLLISDPEHGIPIKIGGDTFDDAIINFIRRNYGMLIGEATAERIKHEIGSAYPGDSVGEISVKGRNLSEGVPRTFTLNSNEILDALQEPLQAIANALKSALEQTPPELGSDIAERGIVLTGGGSLLANIDKLLSEETGLPVILADNPLTCVARGGGKVIEILDQHGVDFFELS